LKIVESVLYIEFDEAVEAGISTKNYLTKAKSTKSGSFTFIDDPADKRRVLIEYDSLKPEHKHKIEQRFGNPYDQVAKEPIRKMVNKDMKAEEFFMAYKYDGNKSLPIDTVKSYVQAASWLNMLVKAKASSKEIKKLLNLSLADFWIKVGEIIESDKIELPSSFRRLNEKINEYQEKLKESNDAAYSTLISKHFGNQRALKVSTELAESLLLELISLPYHDDVVICRNYNQWATQNNHEPITPATVGKWRRDHEHLIRATKNGSKEWYNTHGKQIMRKRPSAPLLLIGSDDNDLDLYFQTTTINKKGHSVVNYFHRFKLIVVMDAFNDYILGYAQADVVTADLVRLAFVDAMHHIKELTGNWYLPHQLQTDQWGKGTLTEFYQSIATYTPATAKVARAKYIEQAFGTKWHQALKLYPNYAGQNITAKHKINEDALALRKKDFPAIEFAPQQVEHFINTMRNLVNDKTGLTKQQEWLQAFRQSHKSQEKAISDMQFLHLFGTSHDYQNRITNKGLTPCLNGMERLFEIPEAYYLESVGKKVQVIYDPIDFSRVLVTDGASLRFIAHEYEKLPSALADFLPGDRARLNHKLEEKRRHVEFISQQKEKRQNLLERNKIDAESLLQAGVMAKELMQDAVSKYAQITYNNTQQNNSREFNPLDSM
jgi:hypothetical protein